MASPRSVIVHSATEDEHGHAVYQSLRARGETVFFLAHDRCFSDWSIDCLNEEVTIRMPEGLVGGPDIAVVFWRQDYQCLADHVQGLPPGQQDIARFVAEQRERHVYGCWYALERTTPFINSLQAHRSVQSKTYQHAVARGLSIRVPETYAGADPVAAESFARRLWDSGRRCCTKNLEATRFLMNGRPHARFTRLFEPQDIHQLESLSSCPMIFQEYIEKRWEYRVTVVGQKAFACRIDSQSPGGETAIDWRHYRIQQTPHHACSLDAGLSTSLLRLCEALGLHYAACDLVHSTNDEIVLLEVNSLGSWLWIEDLVGHPITEAITDVLLDTAHKSCPMQVIP